MSRDGGREVPLQRGPQGWGAGPLSPQQPVRAADPMGLERTAVGPTPSEDGLGGYLFGHHLGQSGDVYEAEHPRFQGRLALKMFRRSTGVGTAAVDAFSREAGRVSILRHPHIVQVMEAGALRDGTPFVSMELLSGQTLDELLAGRGALMASELLPLVRGIASALTAAHAAGIIHREIRPDNVFVVTLAGYEHGFIKVLDFGVSRLTVAERAANGGAGVRAPSYLAPEQVAGRIEDITEAADQFALGALAYRLLSGSDPFVALARPRGLDRVGERNAGPVAPLARRAPAVDAVVSKAMSRHPGDRFQSVALFFRAFEEALAGSALISTPMPIGAREPATGPAPAAAEETPLPLVAPVGERELSRRTLFGPLPSVPHAARDLPTREIPISRFEEFPAPMHPAQPVTPAPVVTAPPPRPAPGMESARPVAAEGHAAHRHRPGVMQDDVSISQQFFYEGERQETERVVNAYRDPNAFSERHHDFDSFDRVPKRRAPMFLAVLLVLAGGAGGAWWMGWRPPQAWQDSEIWKTLRLPPIPPAPSSPPAPVEGAAGAAEDTTTTPVTTGESPAIAPEPPAPVAAPVDAGSARASADAAIAPPVEAAPPSVTAPPARKPAAEKPAAGERDRSPRKSAVGRSDRKPNGLQGFVWSPSQRAYVPAAGEAKESAPPAPPAAPPLSPDEPLPFPR